MIAGPMQLPTRFAARWAVMPAPVNAALLVASFAIGQGSIFVAQTWLVHRGALDLLAAFATHFSFAILGLMIVDAGSSLVMARRISLTEASDMRTTVGRCYLQACIVRLCAAVAVSLAGLCYAFAAGDAFARGYVPAAVPALFIWAFNATGVLDGLKLSGFSGLTVTCAYLASALGLAISGGAASMGAGTRLGLALSFGYALAVLAQLALLHLLGCLPRVMPVSLRACRDFAGEGVAVILSLLPGQLFFRFQIVVCAVVLGEASTAMFLYGRQIAAAVSQVLEFVRRAHFPLMVRDMAGSGGLIPAAFRAQRLATGLAILGAGGVLAAGLLCGLLLNRWFAQAGLIATLFSIGVLTGALSQTLAQAAQAVGCFSVVASAAVLAMLAGLVVTAPMALLFGLAGLAMAEVFTHAAAASLIYVRLSGPSAGAAGAGASP